MHSAMRWFFVLFVLLAMFQCTALRITFTPPAKTQPCEKRLCYEYYLSKMRGFLNGTA